MATGTRLWDHSRCRGPVLAGRHERGGVVRVLDQHPLEGVWWFRAAQWICAIVRRLL